MAHSAAWHQLPSSYPSDVPDLLVATEFTADSYVVRISDMAHVWVEEMDRRAIYKRSLAKDTSIDPTDSPQNMQAFLSRILSAFDASHAHHEGSRMSLSVTDNDSLALVITCEVPGLQPLVWPMYFKRCAPSHVGTKLVLPLLQAEHARIRQVNSLLEIVQQKDVVMTKLLDKLEATGTRLENIFTALSAKQKVSRQTAEAKVRGLAPFRRAEWLAQLAADHEAPCDVNSLLGVVFEAEATLTVPEMNYGDSPALDDWWTKVAAGQAIPIVGPKKAASHKEQTSPLESVEPEDEDDFQVQSTPPHLSSAKTRASEKQPAHPRADDDSTEDEEEHGVLQPSRSSRMPENKNESIHLGVLESKRQTIQPPPLPPGSETESDNSDDNNAAPLHLSLPPQAPSSPVAPTLSKKQGFGHIGKSKPPKAPKAPASQSTDAIAVPSDSKPVTRKLGQIGKKITNDASPNALTGSRGRPAERTEHIEPRETSEDRANKKRDELQRELQRKANAGPARKKRKF
ncbi:conserved hypothetical protein [Verticillium alfalfae VaMs.102]|uniref:Non-homologous end-joining factor 1 n=1 Tax=Verticillium alfalfae (strain VaMs.102 / ATCC MYA-4576 / FGSC 10136) TaxID=526221 RepID=C9SYK1_VERA1|nr:conserved hypothetical protein [Verticillium alfalfae VaMs.102]EEY23866.1 conserved hypothetical protein [Verticillium alfalfae VaMs.102]